MNVPEVRLAAVGDIVQLTPLLDDYRAHFAFNEGDQSSRAFLETIIGSSFAGILIALQNDRLIGYLLFTYSASCSVLNTSIQIVDFWVIPEWRGKGVGSNILGCLEVHAEKKLINYIYLNVLEVRPELHRFYESRGWNQVPLRFYRKALLERTISGS
jgi:GNAT superfamily N-acetyltransferase